MVLKETTCRTMEYQVLDTRMIGHLVSSIARLEQSIEELAHLLKEGYIIPSKEKEVRDLLEQRKTSRMYLRKTLLQVGGIGYMLPYWRIK